MVTRHYDTRHGKKLATINPCNRIGIDAMDARHASWIQPIEDFRSVGSELLLGPVGRNSAKRALQELPQYTNSQFVSKEQFLAAYNYPGIDAHIKRHRELGAVVVNLLDEIRAHPTKGTPLELNLFVTIWLLEHIVRVKTTNTRASFRASRRYQTDLPDSITARAPNVTCKHLNAYLHEDTSLISSPAYLPLLPVCGSCESGRLGVGTHLTYLRKSGLRFSR